MLPLLKSVMVYASVAIAMPGLALSPQNPFIPSSDHVKTDNDSSVSIESQAIVLSSNSLAFQVYNLLRLESENLVFSPLSLTIALGMVYDGADGSTQSQMARILRFPLRTEVIGSAFAKLTQTLRKNARRSVDDLVINMANAIWIQRGSSILPAYITSIVNDYNGAIKQIDFASRTIDARVGINDWIKERTQGKIPELFGHGNIPPNTSMLVVSTIYMRGRWLAEFNGALTRQTPFFPTASKSMTVPMMTVTSSFPLLKESDYALLELPYDSRQSAGIDISMFILLPHEKDGLTLVERQIDASILQNRIAKMQARKVAVSLPRFKLMSTLSFEEILNMMGLMAPFSDNADFSKIDGAQDLKLSKIVQKGFISVDEKGTEAAVSTGIRVVSKGGGDTESPELFVVDHPFMFFILDKVSGAILFIGKVTSP